MNCILETSRLRLREFNDSDRRFIIELLNSPGWLKFIGDKNVKTPEQAGVYLQNGPYKSYKEYGYGLSMVEAVADNKPVGMCGIINRKELEIPDLGFAFLPLEIGKGYGFEIASALIDYAENKLNLFRISAITIPTNTKSIRLLENLGFKFNKTTTFPGSSEELLLYIRDVTK